MKIIKIDRFMLSGTVTIGRMDQYSTLELPWRDNQKGISCIPKGEYECRRVISPRFGETFEVCNVPGRSQILFHAGDTQRDTHGCILIGESGCRTEKEFGQSNSTKAFREFMKDLAGIDRFILKITEQGE